jgi:hypothetical protein
LSQAEKNILFTKKSSSIRFGCRLSRCHHINPAKTASLTADFSGKYECNLLHNLPANKYSFEIIVYILIKKKSKNMAQ